MQRPVVVLPEPLSPTSPMVSPGRTLKVTPSTALTWATTFLNSPFLMGKYCLRSLTSSNGGGLLSGRVCSAMRHFLGSLVEPTGRAGVSVDLKGGGLLLAA